MRITPAIISARVNTPLTIAGHDGGDPNGEPLMANTQHGMLEDAERVVIDQEQKRLTLPEASMFIAALSGALWVLIFGLISLLFA